MFIGGEFVDGPGDALQTINPATEEALAEVGTASVSDVDDAVKAADGRPTTSCRGSMPAPNAESISSVSPVASQERARELAVWRRWDNGKPIKESRDIDIPTASAHFFYHAGWADKFAARGFWAQPRPHWVLQARSSRGISRC